MSERLYYKDAYTTRFTAKVVERVSKNDKTVVVLDRTYFYPESGGQPNDHGKIAGTSVLDLAIREKDDAILHILGGELWANGEVEAEIDWERRFDHMQQHTGQHILSQAFIQVADSPTVGFHLGESVCTIDLPRAGLTPTKIDQAELLANQIIWDNRRIRAFFVPKEKASELPLRKIPEVSGNTLRVVDIDKFDLNACGGTHVANSGEVGQIKIVKLESRKEQVRIHFVCGKRSLIDYKLKNSVLHKLSSELTTGVDMLDDSVSKLQTELKSARKTLKIQQKRLLEFEAEQLWQTRDQVKGIGVIGAVFADRDMGELRMLANILLEQEKVVVLFGNAGINARLLFTKSKDSSVAMDQLLKPALQVLGTTAGGGNDSLAQGGGIKAEIGQVQTAIQRAKKLAIGQI